MSERLDEKRLVDNPFFYKIGEIGHLRELQKGNLYMNKLKYYREYEKDGIGDNEEGLLAKFSEGKMYFRGEEIGIITFGSAYLYSNAPVFCIGAAPLIEISNNHYEHVIDKKVLQDFMVDKGKKYGILLINKSRFIDKIQKQLDVAFYGWWHGKVDYSDNRRLFSKEEAYKYAFHKRMRFSQQNEWRLLLEFDVQNHYIFKIDSIEEDSFLFPIEDSDKDIKFEIKGIKLD